MSHSTKLSHAMTKFMHAITKFVLPALDLLVHPPAIASTGPNLRNKGEGQLYHARALIPQWWGAGRLKRKVPCTSGGTATGATGSVWTKHTVLVLMPCRQSSKLCRTPRRACSTARYRSFAEQKGCGRLSVVVRNNRADRFGKGSVPWCRKQVRGRQG